MSSRTRTRLKSEPIHVKFEENVEVVDTSSAVRPTTPTIVHEVSVTTPGWIKDRKKFVRQNCRNFGLVSKILSDENFCPSKIFVQCFNINVR